MIRALQQKLQSHLHKGKRTMSHNTKTAISQVPFVDTHVHIPYVLEKEGVKTFGELREKSFPENYAACVSVSCDLPHKSTVELISLEPTIYGAFGIHPHNAKEYTAEVEAELLELMKHPKTLAWGECGLDYHYNFSEPQIQREVFEKQLKCAVSLNKPLVIHTREAEDDTWEIFQKHVPVDWKMHIHCFTGTWEFAEKVLARYPNSFFGFTGVITFKNSKDLREVVKKIPVDRLLLETDGPYMAPIPFRGKVAHCGHIPHTAKVMADVKELPLNELLGQVRKNTAAMYGF